MGGKGISLGVLGVPKMQEAMWVWLWLKIVMHKWLVSVCFTYSIPSVNKRGNGKSPWFTYVCICIYICIYIYVYMYIYIYLYNCGGFTGKIIYKCWIFNDFHGFSSTPRLIFSSTINRQVLRGNLGSPVNRCSQFFLSMFKTGLFTYLRIILYNLII